MGKRRWIRVVGPVVLLACVLAVGGFVIWGSTPLGPSPEALSALSSDADVSVETGRWITFEPVGYEPTTGFILYPGGRVDPRSYAPLAREIALRGYEVIIVPMPLNLAVFAPGRAGAVIAAEPAVKLWAIGGHSLGGAMAASYAYDHEGTVDALVLWASYPPSSDDLSVRTDFPVLSIYGTQDHGMTSEKGVSTRALLPPGTCWVVIRGGNHAQFGAYGLQPGDGTAEISAAAQQTQIVDATVSFLNAVERAASGTTSVQQWDGCPMMGGTP